MLTLPLREVIPATSRATIVRIPLQGQPFPYRAGQAVTLAAHGYHERRPYSIASAPEDSERDGVLELLIGLQPDGTPGPHVTLTPGVLIDLEGPFGRFTFPETTAGERFLFVAGGTGIAPLRSMYRHALTRGVTNLAVLYSARTPDDFAYAAELRELARSGLIELEFTVTRAGGDAWRGGRGRIDAGSLRRLLHAPETLCYICGPRAMVDDIPRALMTLGVAAERIRIEEW